MRRSQVKSLPPTHSKNLQENILLKFNSQYLRTSYLLTASIPGTFLPPQQPPKPTAASNGIE